MDPTTIIYAPVYIELKDELHGIKKYQDERILLISITKEQYELGD